jgi:LysM repeat protein
MRLQATVLMLVSFFFVKFAQSQSNELIIQGETGKLYLEHTVVAKENWYSIGRLYNVSPKEIAPFNHLTMGQTLTIGQTLEIPLTAVNFSQDGRKTPAETLVPLVHVIQEKEWMYRISVNHNKVPIPALEKWNNISKDQVHAGLHLIVGYLKVKTALSAFASGGAGSAVAVATSPAGAASPAGARTVIVGAPGIKRHTTDTATTPAHLSASGTTTAPSEEATTAPPVTAPTATAHVDAVTTTPAPVTPAVTSSVATAAAPSAATTPAPPAPHFNGGAFRSDFGGTGKTAGGQAGIFKSTSGWQDGKYYALMNSVAVGTIVKVSDATTGKTVYAKILGQLPDMKESANLAIRLSNAAAAEMGESDGRFNVEVSY